VVRPYDAEQVCRLRGTVHIEHTLARMGSQRLWKLLKDESYVTALGALTGNQAVQQVKAGLKSIYLSGGQVAADANTAGQMYPDQSLYPADSVPNVVRRINNAFRRADQISHSEGKDSTYWFAPIVADAEAGFGGSLNTFELMKAMIEAGAAGVHFEDQLATEKKCGHMGGKVMEATGSFIEKLVAARLASDVCDIPTVIVARTDANGAKLIMTDYDERDRKHMGERHGKFFKYKGGLECAIERGIAYAPFCDMIWCETSAPDLDEAKRFAQGIHGKHPGKLLAYNCSPSFNWKKNLDESTIMKFNRELGAMGYKFQFVTLAGFHALNHSMFELASAYNERGMSAYANFQEKEFKKEQEGYTAVKHQREVGTAYFDEISKVISGSDALSAMDGSTESEQFKH